MSNIANYLPALLAGFLVLLIGVVVAWIVSKLVVRILIFLRLDRVIMQMNWGRALAKGDVRHSLFGIIGFLAALLIFLVFLDNALVIWKLTVLSTLLEKLVNLIPQLLLAGIILLIGWGVATSVSRAVHSTLVQEDFRRAGLFSRVVRSAILVVTCAIALVELRVAVTIVTGAFLIAFGALALGLVLAFGLGSRSAVEKMWEERARQIKERENDAADSRKV